MVHRRKAETFVGKKCLTVRQCIERHSNTHQQGPAGSLYEQLASLITEASFSNPAATTGAESTGHAKPRSQTRHCRGSSGGSQSRDYNTLH